MARLYGAWAVCMACAWRPAYAVCMTPRACRQHGTSCMACAWRPEHGMCMTPRACRQHGTSCMACAWRTVHGMCMLRAWRTVHGGACCTVHGAWRLCAWLVHGA
eukprot:349878-Chlamydomonas_euryale.AAC.6